MFSRFYGTFSPIRTCIQIISPFRTTPRCPSKEDRRKSRSSKNRNNNNNNHSDSGPESAGGGLGHSLGHVTTKKEIIDQVVGGGHHIPGQHMSSNDLTSGLIGQQNSLTDSYIQPGKQKKIFLKKKNAKINFCMMTKKQSVEQKFC